MKITQLVALQNPVATVGAVYLGLVKMPEREFREKVAEMLNRAKQFVQSDDSAFGASLSPEDADAYASSCSSLAKALRNLESDTGKVKEVTAGFLAEVITWWQFLDHARDLCGGSVGQKA